MDETRYFRMAPEYRRSLTYVMASLFVLVPVGVGVHALRQQRPPDGAALATGAALLVVGLVATLTLLAWRLRIDNRGLARRILFWWDRWDWTDLASGRIEKRNRSLVDPERPWWRRTLRLEWMTSEDLRSVVEQINEHYRLPSAPPVPESLRIKYAPRRSVSFDRNGVTFRARGRLLAYRWDEIRRVHIRRLDPVRRDFVRLEIFLPEDVVELMLVSHQGGTSPSWSGGKAEQINQILFEHLPPEQIQEDVVGGPAATREDLERSISEARKRDRVLFHVTWVYGAGLAACFLYLAFDRGVLRAAAIIGLSYLWFLPVFWWMYCDCRKRTRGLEAERAKFQEDVPDVEMARW